MGWETLRRTRNKYKAKARKVAEMEKNPEQHNDKLDKLAALFERSGIDPDDVSKIQRVNVWQGFYKDAEGEAQTVDMVGVQFIPKADELTEDMFIRQAAPTVIKPSKVKARTSREKTAIVLPDIQAGFRYYEDGTKDPLHDEKALDVALQIIRDVQPDEVLLNGDNLDLPQFSKFNNLGDLTFAETLNPTLDYVHNLLAQIRANAPNTKITYLEGNHEIRLRRYIQQYAKEVLNVRQAGQGDRLLTVQFLLNLAGVECDYVSGYPGGRYFINDRLSVVHGNIVRPAGQSAAAYVKNYEDSVLFGHIHRKELAHRTAQRGRTARYLIAQSFGCLARIDGIVPSYGSGVDETDDRHVTNYENWQHGLGLIEYMPGDRPFNSTQIDIRTFDGYETSFNGKLYLPTKGD